MIVWAKKKVCRRWLGRLIQEKWKAGQSLEVGKAGSKLSRNWQSKSASLEGQGSRSEGWTEEDENTFAGVPGWPIQEGRVEEDENSLPGQGWSLANGEKEAHYFVWEKNSRKVGKGNNWRNRTTNQKWKQEGFGQRLRREEKGRRQSDMGATTTRARDKDATTRKRGKDGETTRARI